MYICGNKEELFRNEFDTHSVKDVTEKYVYIDSRAVGALSRKKNKNWIYEVRYLTEQYR